MSSMSLTNAMTSMSIDDCKSSSVSLSTSTAQVENVTNTESLKFPEEQVRKLGLKILGPMYEKRPFHQVLENLEPLIRFNAIMAQPGLKIFNKGDELRVGCCVWSSMEEGGASFSYAYVPKTTISEMEEKIQAIVARAYMEFSAQNAIKPAFDEMAPVFDKKVFELALEGKDSDVIALNEVFKKHSKTIEEIIIKAETQTLNKIREKPDVRRDLIKSFGFEKK